MMVYNLELRKSNDVRAKIVSKNKKKEKKRAEKLTDEKNLKTQATAHFISDDFVLFFSAMREELNGHKIVS